MSLLLQPYELLGLPGSLYPAGLPGARILKRVAMSRADNIYLILLTIETIMNIDGMEDYLLALQFQGSDYIY